MRLLPAALAAIVASPLAPGVAARPPRDRLSPGGREARQRAEQVMSRPRRLLPSSWGDTEEEDL
ncbi:hypothetical protein [Nonomuraea mesophila]|uniref:hypothetical protein n=1 Tax=Nonomuraea mesophila TaxID=2530382 RepID=UPI00140A170D|nr:hypothetical protein [Nonomuraea mesophila]